MIPKTMKALVAYGKHDYKLETNYPVPECGPDDILIKTEGCGICAGDLKCMHGAERFWGNETEPSWVKPPFIPGHEFLGRIVAVGENVKEYKLGERITADQIVPCGECRFCKSGRYWMCQPHATFGFQAANNGGMAEYVRYPKTAVLHRVPEDMPLEKALLVEPYACSKHCVDRAQITNEDVLDMMDSRLEKAKEFGADLVWNPSKMDVTAEIMKLTDGYGCDIYIEATGHPSSVTQGMNMIRKLGRFVEFSVFGAPTTLDWSVIGDGKELDVLGSHLSPYCFPFVIDHIHDGSLKTDGMITQTFALEDWEKAFDYATGKYGHFKIAFVF